MKLWTTICCAALLAAGAATVQAAAPGADVPMRETPPARTPPPSAAAEGKDTPASSVPVRPAQPERRGKYANPYDRSVPYQGSVHQNYKYGKKDPYKRH